MKVAEALIALSALRAGRAGVLCGDDRQLAPVVRGPLRRGRGLPLRLGLLAPRASTSARLPLRESRRMNRALVGVPARALLSRARLHVARRRHRACAAPPPPTTQDALLRDLFLRPERRGRPLHLRRACAPRPATPSRPRLVARLARLARAGAPRPARAASRYGDDRFAAEALAVLSPHRAQNSAILAELRASGCAPRRSPVVDTVERMQGNEREMILVSYGVADREYAEAEAEFLLDPNRFNVSVTRARAKLDRPGERGGARRAPRRRGGARRLDGPQGLPRPLPRPERASVRCRGPDGEAVDGAAALPRASPVRRSGPSTAARAPVTLPAPDARPSRFAPGPDCPAALAVPTPTSHGSAEADRPRDPPPARAPRRSGRRTSWR